MSLPTNPAPPARYTVVPLLGPDGAGKTSLVHALGDYVARRDGLPAPPLRAVPNATVLDARTPYGVLQLVDFANAATEDALLDRSPFQGALLVVDATQGVMEGTVRSLAHAREVHIARVVVAITKCDLIEDRELIDLTTTEIRERLNDHGFGGERGESPIGCVAGLPASREDQRWAVAIGRLFDAVQAWVG